VVSSSVEASIVSDVQDTSSPAHKRLAQQHSHDEEPEQTCAPAKERDWECSPKPASLDHPMVGLVPEKAVFAVSPALVDHVDVHVPSVQAWEAPATASPTIEMNLGPLLPPEPHLRELIDLFFEYVYPWAPLFHRESFLNEAFAPHKQILLHGIIVATDRFWTKPEPTISDRQAQLKVSKDQVLLSAMDSTSVPLVQALTLLAIDAVGQGPGPRAWNIMAMLVTSARQLQLGRSGSQPPDACDSPLIDHDDAAEGTYSDDDFLSNTEAEERRRLFWTIYSLDRFSNMPLGRPSAIDSRFIKLQYPVRDSDWGQAASEWFQRPSPLRPCRIYQQPLNLWHYYIDVLTMVDQSNQLLIQPVNLSMPANCEEWQSNFRRLEVSIFSWFENLPSEVREKPKNFDPLWTLIHATFYL
jgi:hypothetical protein